MSASNSENPDACNSETSEMLNNSAIKLKILCGEFKVSNKRGTSKVWNIFGKIENSSGEELHNLVCCRICTNIYKYNNKSTSNLVRHKCYAAAVIDGKNITKINVDTESKKCITNDIVAWTVKNCRPFRVVEDFGFRKVAEDLISIGAKYGPNVNIEHLLPHPTTISRNLNKVYGFCFEKIKKEIATIKSNGYGLTSDLWTDNFLKKTYIALTMHYIKEGEIRSRLLGMKCMEGERCTST